MSVRSGSRPGEELGSTWFHSASLDQGTAVLAVDQKTGKLQLIRIEERTQEVPIDADAIELEGKVKNSNKLLNIFLFFLRFSLYTLHILKGDLKYQINSLLIHSLF